jgi:hypothetical protein
VLRFVGALSHAAVADPKPTASTPASLFFGGGCCGKLLILAFRLMPFRCRRWGRPCKSGGPPLFALSLKVHRDTHYPAPDLRSCWLSA